MREAPARAIALADVGFRVYYQSDKLPRELEPSLEATAHYTPARPITWANGAAHLVVVDVRHLGRPRHLETPSPFTVGGFKGIAEAGTAGAPGAIVNAVNDALAPLAVRLTRQPITPDLILAALRGARG